MYESPKEVEYWGGSDVHNNNFIGAVLKPPRMRGLQKKRLTMLDSKAMLYS